MRVVYWAKMSLARAEITEALEGVEGIDLAIVETLADLLPALDGAEALVLPDTSRAEAAQVTAALSAPGATVKWMHFLTAGREGFDAAGLPEGVAVTHPAGCVAPTVAEHAMTLLTALARRVPDMLEKQRDHMWERVAVSRGARTLEDGTMAIVGYGKIGSEIAKRAKAFGVHTVGVSRSATSDEYLDEAVTLDRLDEVLGRSDFVMLAIALTGETAQMFDRARLARCRQGALLVNIARGGLIDQGALAEALASGRLGGAGLDAVDPEPLPSHDPLWEAPNLILSPHFGGGASAASRRRLAALAAGNLRRFRDGAALENLVT